MKCCNKLSWVVLVLIVVINLASLALGQQPRDKLESAWIEPHVGRMLPLTSEFIEHNGQEIQLGDEVGKRPVVLCMVYFECPMLCKLAADGLVRSVASLPENVGQDLDIVFVSFDPRDTPERAKAAREHALLQYARAGSEKGWHFLTGNQASIDQIAQAVGFHYLWDEETQQFAHATGIMIITPEGRISEYLDGINFSPRELSSAIGRAAKNELTESGATLFMRCYLYDPTTGKFGAAVQWTIRVLGLATVLALILLVFRLARSRSLSTIESESL
ncbi:MAG: SCO family protein [Planctomycetales bacterium]|nr:SCO family protein [Planctomycetales bacterium]